MHGGPVDGCHHAISQQRNVESKLRGGRIDKLFSLRQEVEQQRTEAAVLQDLCNGAIAWTMTAAAASVRKHDQSTRVGRQAQIAVEHNISNVEANRPRRY